MSAPHKIDFLPWIGAIEKATGQQPGRKHFLAFSKSTGFGKTRATCFVGMKAGENK